MVLEDGEVGNDFSSSLDGSATAAGFAADVDLATSDGAWSEEEFFEVSLTDVADLADQGPGKFAQLLSGPCQALRTNTNEQQGQHYLRDPKQEVHRRAVILWPDVLTLQSSTVGTPKRGRSGCETRPAQERCPRRTQR